MRGAGRRRRAVMQVLLCEDDRSNSKFRTGRFARIWGKYDLI
jgi:hypothetical protein